MLKESGEESGGRDVVWEASGRAPEDRSQRGSTPVIGLTAASQRESYGQSRRKGHTREATAKGGKRVVVTEGRGGG